MRSRFAGMLTGAGLLLTLAGGTQAAEVTMNLGWATPLESTYGDLAVKFEELAEKYSEGSVDVKLRCCAQIATEDDAFKALQLGTVDAYFISQNNVSPHWPMMDVFVLPYIFQNSDHLVKVANGPVGDRIREQIKADTGVHLLTFGGPSYRDFFNSKRPINTIEDMAGLKIRVPKNEVMLATFEAFGAEPVPLAWSETPTALQTGTIDGGDNGTSVIREMKFFEFAENLVVLDHFAGFAPVFASDRFMGKLDDAQRDAVLRAAADAGAYHTALKLEEIESIRSWLSTEGGMAMTRPERGPFIAAAQQVQQDFAARRGEAFTELVNAIQEVAE
ncbi:MAG: TRAP transporter substrate-binding protein [Kiloniellales bacterium]|nr:TRAP transporter substrate-binding protein [Kiloniellales bacterium]